MENENIYTAQVINTDLVSSKTKDTIVPWWSFGKTVLATAILALIRDGKLSLDDRHENKPYTIRQLLQHTSGLPDYGGLKSYHEAVARGDNPWSVDELLSHTQADILLSDPGSKFRYSNIGYLFLRQLIENTTGLGIEGALQNLVFIPLDIPNVKLAKSPNDFDSIGLSGGQSYNPGWLYHGLLFGPLSSAVLFLNHLFLTDFLPDNLKEEMISPFKIADSIAGRPFKNPSYGLGLMIGETEAGICVGHGGEGLGSTIAIYHFRDTSPTKTIGVFIEQNTPESSGKLEGKAINLAQVPFSAAS